MCCTPIRIPPLLALIAGHEEIMVDWAFERDADGQWRWMHVDQRGVTRSRRRFGDLWDCVEDAKKHGLEERGLNESPPPALLH
jgi:hypothetical protein